MVNTASLCCVLCGTRSNEVWVQTYMSWHSNILKQKCGIDKDQYLFWKFLLSLCLRLFWIMLWLSFVHSFFVVTWMLAGESRLNFCFPKSNDGSVFLRWFSLHWVPVVSVPNNLFFLQPWCNIEGSCFLLSQPMPHCEFLSVRIFGFEWVNEMFQCSLTLEWLASSFTLFHLSCYMRELIYLLGWLCSIPFFPTDPVVLLPCLSHKSRGLVHSDKLEFYLSGRITRISNRISC